MFCDAVYVLRSVVESLSEIQPKSSKTPKYSLSRFLCRVSVSSQFLFGKVWLTAFRAARSLFDFHFVNFLISEFPVARALSKLGLFISDLFVHKSASTLLPCSLF